MGNQIEVTNELVTDVKGRILKKLIPLILLVSEKSMTSDKLDIDTTDITDNNSIKLARDISEKVYNLLPQIVSEVGEEIRKDLGETENARL